LFLLGTSFFQIFVLTDSKELSLEIGIHPEFAKEKTDEMKRYVLIDLGLLLFIPSRHACLSKMKVLLLNDNDTFLKSPWNA